MTVKKRELYKNKQTKHKNIHPSSFRSNLGLGKYAVDKSKNTSKSIHISLKLTKLLIILSSLSIKWSFSSYLCLLPGEQGYLFFSQSFFLNEKCIFLSKILSDGLKDNNNKKRNNSQRKIYFDGFLYLSRPLAYLFIVLYIQI